MPIAIHHRQVVCIFAAVTLAALSACGLPGQAAAPTPTPHPDTAALVRQLMQCIRSHGNPDFPEPTIDGRGVPQWPDGTQKPSAEALQACGALYDRLPRSSDERGPTAAELAQLRQFAQCMRQHGFDRWPDPNPDGSFSLPPDIQAEGKSQRLLDAWRNHCDRYNPSGHISVSAGG